MGVRILYDEAEDSATLYCSTSMWAFGPVFSGVADEHGQGRDGEQRALAFLYWLDTDAPYATYDKTQIGERRDARCLTDAGMEAAYSDWLAQEEAQYRAAQENRPAAEIMCDESKPRLALVVEPDPRD